MGIKDDVSAALKTFEEQNPDAKGKAYLTSGSRTWHEQLDIILQPKRAKNYTNIKGRFLKKFKKQKLPAKRDDMSEAELTWWQTEINAQAGKVPGFAHVGGFAQDVSVKNLTTEQKKALKKVLSDKNVKVLPERVLATTSQFKNVTIEKANVFHCYK